MIGRLPILKKHPALGNVRPFLLLPLLFLRSSLNRTNHRQLFFWFGLLSGFPLLAIA